MVGKLTASRNLIAPLSTRTLGNMSGSRSDVVVGRDQNRSIVYAGHPKGLTLMQHLQGWDKGPVKVLKDQGGAIQGVDGYVVTT